MGYKLEHAKYKSKMNKKGKTVETRREGGEEEKQKTNKAQICKPPQDPKIHKKPRPGYHGKP